MSGRKRFFLGGLFFIIQSMVLTAYNDEYLYPVSSVVHDGVEKMCVLHQKGSHLELWFWDPLTTVATKGLLSSFNPTGVCVLPSKQAFSFIDNDRIKVKSIVKRSPQSIDLYGPYDLTTINWIDDSSFYFGAKERHHGNLFHATIDGELCRLTVSKSSDYLYPQKVGEDFFFIEKDSEQNFSIIHTKYPTDQLNEHLKKINSEQNFQEQIKLILEENDTSYHSYLDPSKFQKIIEFGHRNSAFLTMVSSQEGFFIEHPSVINKDDDFLEFLYNRLFYQNNQWNVETIFSFAIPLHLLLRKRGSSRLYESILPLLPLYQDGKVYFSHMDKADKTLNCYVYDIACKFIEQRTFSGTKQQHCFAPRPFGTSFFSGGVVVPELFNKHTVTIDIAESGQEYFYLLEINR